MFWIIVIAIVMILFCRKGNKEHYSELDTRVSDLESSEWTENNYYE